MKKELEKYLNRKFNYREQMIFKIKKGKENTYYVETKGIAMGNISRKELFDFIRSELKSL